MENRRPRWKSLFRFTLRASLVLLTLACVYMGVKSNRVAQQRRAVNAILSAGGRVTYAHETKLGERVYSTVDRRLAQKLDDDWFFSVEGVTLYGDGCTDEVAKHVGKLTSLKRVALWAWAEAPRDGPIGGSANTTQPRAGVTDKGVEYLAELPKLEHISFLGNRVTDAAIKQLKDFPALNSVQVDLDKGSEVSREAYDSLMEALE